MIRVLVVDDSAFMRKVVKDILESEPGIQVVGTARNGKVGIEQAIKLRPDVITMDVEMPKMDGLAALSEIMKAIPTPVVMLSTLTTKGTDTTIKALEAGAVDFIGKPSGSVSIDIEKISDDIISKVKIAAKAHVKKTKVSGRKILPSIMKSTMNKVIAIGSSTGGPQTLLEILVRLPENIPPIFIVQHMPPGFTKSLANRLNSYCSFDVKEAEEGDTIRGGLALMAPGGYHMTVKRINLENKEIIHLTNGPSVNAVKPSVDVMLESVVKIYGKNTLGVILTGMGGDGANGMCLIKKSGGKTIAQDEASCVVFGMPKVAIEKGCVDRVATLSSIPEKIMLML